MYLSATCGHAYLWEEELIDATHSEYTVRMRAQLRLKEMICLIDNLCILENTGGRRANVDTTNTTQT